MNIILIILVFGVIVFFHELGHFIVAKLNKVAVTEFSIGMGPAIFSLKRKETKYSLRILPIGGYCMMDGENGESDDENSFNNKPVWVRMLVVLAGPFFNFILAFIFGVILIHYTGYDPSVFSNVMENSPAEMAGIEPGDKVIKINGDRVYNYREFLLFMQLNCDSDDPIALVMEKPDGTRYDAVITPRITTEGVYIIGVSGGYIESPNFANDVKYGALELRYWMKATALSLKMIFTGQVKSDDIMGPLGVGGAMNDVIEEVKEESPTKKDAVINILLNMMNWCILLSVNLGIMNLLPIPALDGGRFLFLLIEAVRRKKIPQDKEAIVNFIGFGLLMLLMVVVFFNDIKNVFF